ncbi:ATP-dependent helicase [bacterium]|nr:ATP-dependent helicase [bacterium]
MNLNEQQQKIVNTEGGRIAVVAGAGSGKSTTNIELIAKLHRNNNVPLERMFISTFTNKAGRDLKLKLSSKLGLDQKSLDRIWVGTFHSLGYKYLTQIRKIKLEIILPIEGKQYLRNIYKQVVKENRVNEKDFTFIKAIRCIEDKRNKEYNFKDMTEYSDECQEIFNMYQEEKRKMGLVDYADILELFEGELIKDSLFTSKFDWVFVDEAQDNSKKQNDIAELLTNKNRILIGDSKQSIYLFRGAAPKMFKEKIDSSEKVYSLAYNYRSSKEIIDFANTLLLQMNSFKGQELIPTQPSKRKPEIVFCDNQAYEIYKAVERDISSGIPLEEIAILGRSIKPMVFQRIQLLFRSKGLPYTMRGGDDKLNATYIQNYLSVLKSVLKPTKVSLTNSLSLLPGVGPKTAMKLAEQVVAAGGSFDPLVNNTGKFVTTKAYQAYIHLEELTYDNKELILKALEFIHDFYLVPVYSKKDPSEPSNKRKIIFDSLFDYLMDFPNLIEGIDSLYINEEDLESEKGKIIISTIHQSKGLEWDSVHIANFHEGSLPNLKAEDEGDSERLEEEFCITYVAITRAKKYLRLYMSHQDERMGGGTKLSRFFKHIYRTTKDKFFTLRVLDVISESNYKESLYTKLRVKYGS